MKLTIILSHHTHIRHILFQQHSLIRLASAQSTPAIWTFTHLNSRFLFINHLFTVDMRNVSAETYLFKLQTLQTPQTHNSLTIACFLSLEFVFLNKTTYSLTPCLWRYSNKWCVVTLTLLTSILLKVCIYTLCARYSDFILVLSLDALIMSCLLVFNAHINTRGDG